MADALISQTGYLGIFLVLVLGGLGLPVPEEVPIIGAAVLVRKGTMHWIPALGSCLSGVLIGDFVVYFLGFFYGEKVLKLPLTRKFLTKEREAQIQGYFHRHGVKILILGRFAVGFRTAAYLTAGILRLPPLRLFLTDLCAASGSTLLMFGLGYAFATKLEEGMQEAKHYIVGAVALGIVGWIVHRYVKARLKAGRVIGPAVLVAGEGEIPPSVDITACDVAVAPVLIAAATPTGTATVEPEAVPPAAGPVASLAPDRVHHPVPLAADDRDADHRPPPLRPAIPVEAPPVAEPAFAPLEPG